MAAVIITWEGAVTLWQSGRVRGFVGCGKGRARGRWVAGWTGVDGRRRVSDVRSYDTWPEAAHVAVTLARKAQRWT